MKVYFQYLSNHALKATNVLVRLLARSFWIGGLYMQIAIVNVEGVIH